MHQIRFRLGLRPKPRWGSSQRSPGHSWILGGPTSQGKRDEKRGRHEKGGKGKKGRVRKERDKRKRGGRGRGTKPPSPTPIEILGYATARLTHAHTYRSVRIGYCTVHERWNRGSRESSCSPNFFCTGEQAIALAPPKVWAFCTAMLDWVEST